MVWFFARDGQALRVETRFDEVAREYVIVAEPQGEAPKEERFRDEAIFQVRLNALEAKLAADRWSQVGDPAVLPYGWRGLTH